MSETETIVKSYLAAIAERDFEQARTFLCERGYRYISPIGSYDDADRFIQSISVLGPILERVEIRKCFTSDKEALVIVDSITTMDGYETSTSAILFSVEAGCIRSMETIFDASNYHKMFSNPT